MKQARRIDGTPIGISVYSVQSTSAHNCDLHTEEIILCLKGSVHISYIYREIDLHKGEFISINHDMFFMTSDEENLCVSIYIDTHSYEKKFPDICYRQHVCVGAPSEIYTPVMGYPTPETDRFLCLLLTLLRRYTTECNASDINLLSDRIVESLMDDFDVIYFMNGNKNIKDDVHYNLTQAVTYVYRNYQEKITQERFAELLGISPNYVNEYLKKAGLDFKLICNFAKIYAAERLLTSTDKSIMDISEEAGFSSPKYLYLHFKNWFGCTPSEFRNKYCRKIPTEVTFHEPEEIADIVEKMMLQQFQIYFTRTWDV